MTRCSNKNIDLAITLGVDDYVGDLRERFNLTLGRVFPYCLVGIELGDPRFFPGRFGAAHIPYRQFFERGCDVNMYDVRTVCSTDGIDLWFDPDCIYKHQLLFCDVLKLIFDTVDNPT